MVMYRIALTDPAKRFFENADRQLQRRLDRAFDRLKHNPRSHPNIKPLTGNYAGYFRYRVGDYRIVYAIDEPNEMVTILVIANRRDVYR